MKRYVRPQAGLLLVTITLSILAALVAILVQFVKGNLLDSAIAGQGGLTLRLAGLMLGLILCEILCYYLFNRFRGAYTTRVKEHLRADFFVSFLERPQRLSEQRPTGEVLASYTEKLDTVARQMLANIPLLVEVALKIIIVSAALLMLDVRIAVITLLLSTTPLYVPRLIQRRLQQAQAAHTTAFEHHLGKVAQWLAGLELIRSFGAQAAIRQRFDASSREVRDRHLAMLKTNYLSQALSTSLSYLSHFVILAYAAWLVAQGSFTAGQFFIAVGMIDQMSYPILSISIYLQEMIAAGPVLAALQKEMSFTPALAGPGQAMSTMETITFCDTTFHYPDGPCLFRGLNLQVNAGQKVLVSGPSGGGKSTLMNLLLAYASPVQGEILLNGLPAQQVSNLQELIAVMRQEPVLFEDSLRDNLSLYQVIPDERLITVLSQLNLSQFASKQGLDYLVSEGGANLSGGQRRRLSLARALLRQAPVLIMDEPLAEVDPDTAAMIEDIIISLSGITLFVVSHQASPQLRAAFDHQLVIGR